jgi:hypothetical protein
MATVSSRSTTRIGRPGRSPPQRKHCPTPPCDLVASSTRNARSFRGPPLRRPFAGRSQSFQATKREMSTCGLCSLNTRSLLAVPLGTVAIRSARIAPTGRGHLPWPGTYTVHRLGQQYRAAHGVSADNRPARPPRTPPTDLRSDVAGERSRPQAITTTRPPPLQALARSQVIHNCRA